MSVTSLLKEDTPFKRWLHTNLPLSVICTKLQEHNFTMKREPLIVRPDGPINYPLGGMAFTYGLRWWIMPDLKDWIRGTAAIHGLKAAGMTDAFVSHFKDYSALGALLLAEFDRMGRIHEVWQVLDKDMNYVPHDPTYANTINDVGALCETIEPVLNRHDVSGHIVPNPTFTGSLLVGGADAQLIIDHTMFDVRTTMKKEPAQLTNFYQQISYLLLDVYDHYRIENLAWYYSRQRAMFVYPVDAILPDVTGLRHRLLGFLYEQKNQKEPTSEMIDISFRLS